MTKKEYMEKHKKSDLARALLINGWPDDAEIDVIGGLIAPNTKRSNLYRALERSKNKKYCVGGHRWNGPDGFWMAVY